MLACGRAGFLGDKCVSHLWPIAGNGPGVNVWKHMNKKQGVAGKNKHPERSFSAYIKVKKTAAGLLVT